MCQWMGVAVMRQTPGCAARHSIDEPLGKSTLCTTSRKAHALTPACAGKRQVLSRELVAVGPGESLCRLHNTFGLDSILATCYW